MNKDKVPNEFIFKFSRELLVAPLTDNSIGIYVYTNQDILAKFGDDIYDIEKWIIEIDN